MAFAGMLLLMLIAGCFAPDEGPEQAGDEESDGAQGDRGVIAGTVSSDLFEPLPGARLETLTLEREPTDHATDVDEDGTFRIEGIEPGDYILFVTAIGYRSAQQHVSVAAGEKTEIRFVLEVLPSDEPWVQEIDVTGFVNWAAAWQVEVPTQGCVIAPGTSGLGKTCGGLRGGGSESGETRFGPQQAVDGWQDIGGEEDFHEVDLEHVETIIVELEWEPAGSLGRGFLLDLMCTDVPRGSGGAVEDTEHDCYFDVNGESPLYIRADRNHSRELDYNWTGTWAVRVFASYGTLGTHDLTGIDAGLVYQQDFDKYITIFHREPAPEDFSRLPDA